MMQIRNTVPGTTPRASGLQYIANHPVIFVVYIYVTATAYIGLSAVDVPTLQRSFPNRFLANILGFNVAISFVYVLFR